MLKIISSSLLISITSILFGISPSIGESRVDDNITYIKITGSHEYDPPTSGMLSRKQVEEFITITEQAIALEGKHPNKTYKTQLALIEAVYNADGNWAEYKWIHSQLSQLIVTNKINVEHRDAANRHNRRLFEAYQDRLQPLLQ